MLPDAVKIQRLPVAGKDSGEAPEVLPEDSSTALPLKVLKLNQNREKFVLTSSLGRGRVFVRVRSGKESSEGTARENTNKEQETP